MKRVAALVFDHRNESLRQWLVDECVHRSVGCHVLSVLYLLATLAKLWLSRYVGGKEGIGHPDISGMYVSACLSVCMSVCLSLVVCQSI